MNRQVAAPVSSRGAPEPGSATSPKLSDVVYEAVLERIVDRRYEVGSRLPTENNLAEEFGISRPVVREALARLRDDGVIRSRRGSGTYVQRSLSNAAIQLAPLSSIADMGRCYEFRIALEGEIAYHAALPGAEVHRSHLDGALERLSAAVESNVLGAEEDFDFHCAIARATGNRFFEGALLALHDSVLMGMTVTRSLSLLRPRDRLMAVHAEHLDIADAIHRNDPDGARRSMRFHIENARRRVFEGTGAVEG